MRLLLLGCWYLAVPWGQALAAAPPEKIPVAASIVPLGDFCQKIGGDLVAVQVLIPPGASPHIFEPPPSVMVKAFKARVFVYVGAGLEPWAARFLESRGIRNLVVVEAAQGLPLIQEVGGPHHGEATETKPGGRVVPAGEEKAPAAHGEHRHEAGNPHLWLDPVLAKEICRKIAAGLIQADPQHRGQYEANLRSYLAALDELDREILQRSATWRLRDFISFHPAFTYFARRYNLRELGAIELAPGREPTPRHLKDLVKAIKTHGIRVVFAEPQLNPRVAESVAREAGVKVLMLDPEGSRPPYGLDYLKMMRHNLDVMEEAMK